MASSTNRSTRSTKTNSRTRKKAGSRKIDQVQLEQDKELFHEIGMIVLCVAMLFLFFCNFGIIGPVGNGIRDFMFGLFGFLAYVTPILIFLAVSFWFANEGNPTALRKLIAGVVLYLMVGAVCELIAGPVRAMDSYDVKVIYESCKAGKCGGGIFAGSLTYLLYHNLEMVGTILIVLLCTVISIILLTERSFLDSMREGKERIRELSVGDPERRLEDAERREEAREIAARRREEANRRREEAQERRREEAEGRREAAEKRREEARQRKEEQERLRAEREEERRLRAEELENEKILRMEKKVAGVTADTALKTDDSIHKGDIHEITYQGDATETEQMRIRTAHAVNLVDDREEETETVAEEAIYQPRPAAEQTVAAVPYRPEKTEPAREPVQQNISVGTAQYRPAGREEQPVHEVRPAQPMLTHEAEKIRVHKDGVEDRRADSPAGAAGYAKPEVVVPAPDTMSPVEKQMQKDMKNAEKKAPKKYMFPPISCLQKGETGKGDSAEELKETAMRLQQTLNTFGVKVTITEISQGPSVTRYELQPEQGVKVSKIVGLSDDIKLNLAATDIRIEAPIPGKAAIGIEVPNKENMMVSLRDLLESKEFKEFPSNIAFAVGKDIAGKTVVADIAKMPHMLIAGSTGSGKSVCINTLIMSILYKANPSDVKLIMVDPKVVELSVYNGIPHLLIPVVTDPKKASAALHWAVSEMEDRYRKFADYNVRDLKGYNQKLETLRENGEEDVPEKLPQIVIIVDELADLMMVCPGEVEESICRLAQLARACGIHLIIATQRPSVDVITGLIKANMPSRVAFAVSSGVDSRTILDMVGAEKLLGKGDMLFYPQGYSKPARIQGAFVSDKEVSDVVDFLKNQMIGNTYAEDIEEKIKNLGSSQAGGAASGGASSGGDNGRDEYFEEAARFIIDKDKASIGMLQRVLKIGFNRAARIMDQLCEYGVVGEEEGTKPRKVLMSMEQFEQLLEEI